MEEGNKKECQDQGNKSISNNKLKTYLEVKNQPWKPVLEESGSSDWHSRWYLDGNVAKVEPTCDGLYFTSGEEFLNDAHHGVLWTKASYFGDIKIEYDYKRMDEEHRCVNILYLCMEGAGASYGKDIETWKDKRAIPKMSLYFEHMTGIHISYAAFENTADITPGYIRCRRYLGGPLEGTLLEPEYDGSRYFETGVWYHITCIKEGRDIYFHVKNGEKEQLCHWTLPKNLNTSQGAVGLRQMFTRKSLYKNIIIAQK